MMNKKEIFAKIGTIVKEIREQHEYLSENPEHVNELELELFLANSRFLTGHIEIFQKLARAEGTNIPAEPGAVLKTDGEQARPADSKVISQERVPNPDYKGSGDDGFMIKEVIEVYPPDPEYHDEDHMLEPGPKTHQDEPAAFNKIYLDVEPIEDEPVEEEPLAEAPEEPDNETEEAVEESPELLTGAPIAIVPDPAAAPAPSSEHEAVPTVNDIISAQLNAQSTLAGQFTAKPVKDLKSIISLNDKLLFVKDLFNGYSLAYSEAIELLNRFDSFEAADNFLKSNYSVKNNWTDKQATVDHFYEILNRRFGR